LLAIGPILVVLGGLYMYLNGGRYVGTDNAYVHEDKLNLTTDVAGIVKEIPVGENERVTQGQVLVRLDPQVYRIALAAARAQLDTVRNELTTLQANYRQNQAQVELAKSDLAYYEPAYQRQVDLAKRGVASQATLDQARRDYETARQRLVAAERAAEATLAQLGGSADRDIALHPRYQQALAQVDKAQRDLDHAVITAPMEGIVTNVPSLQLGAYLQPGQPAFSLVATDRAWVDANPKETDLTYVKPGDPASVEVDTYPDRVWKGRVASISPASAAEFSVLPAQNASGNWVKVVQRIPVRIALDLSPNAPPLRSGMSAVVEIDTGHQRTLGDLLRTTAHWIGL
jgi:membrane fusion protein (multidrug efflux system)